MARNCAWARRWNLARFGLAACGVLVLAAGMFQGHVAFGDAPVCWDDPNLWDERGHAEGPTGRCVGMGGLYYLIPTTEPRPEMSVWTTEGVRPCCEVVAEARIAGQAGSFYVFECSSRTWKDYCSGKWGGR